MNKIKVDWSIESMTSAVVLVIYFIKLKKDING